MLLGEEGALTGSHAQLQQLARIEQEFGLKRQRVTKGGAIAHTAAFQKLPVSFAPLLVCNGRVVGESCL